MILEDTNLDVPLITFVIFWTVLSVMDSVLESFGDLAREERESDDLGSDLDPLLPSSSLSPPRKELDFFNLVVEIEGWGEGGWDDSLARAPNNCRGHVCQTILQGKFSKVWMKMGNFWIFCICHVNSHLGPSRRCLDGLTSISGSGSFTRDSC